MLRRKCSAVINKNKEDGSLQDVYVGFFVKTITCHCLHALFLLPEAHE